MKTPIIIAFSLACVTFASAEPEKTAPTPVLRPTHADMVKKQQERDKDKAKITQQNPSAKPLVKTKKRSLIGNSTLLTSFGKWTLIPRGSIIHLPKRLQNKIASKPQGELVNWKIFLQKNRGWIHLHPTTMVQAQGKESIKPKTIKAYQSMGKIVVAVCAGGPISVAPSAYKLENDKKD